MREQDIAASPPQFEETLSHPSSPSQVEMKVLCVPREALALVQNVMAWL